MQHSHVTFGRMYIYTALYLHLALHLTAYIKGYVEVLFTNIIFVHYSQCFTCNGVW